MVRGRGGHASAPHLALDPVPVAAELILALQSAVTRRVDVFDPAVLTIAHIEGGTTNNIIPASVAFEGTIRTVSPATRELMADLVHQVAAGVAAAHGAVIDLEIVPGYPVTLNDPAVTAWIRDLAVGLAGEDQVEDLAAPIMGAEDFSYVLERVPGMMAFLGARPSSEDPETAPAEPLQPRRLRRGLDGAGRGPVRRGGARSSAGLAGHRPGTHKKDRDACRVRQAPRSTGAARGNGPGAVKAEWATGRTRHVASGGRSGSRRVYRWLRRRAARAGVRRLAAMAIPRRRTKTRVRPASDVPPWSTGSDGVGRRQGRSGRLGLDFTRQHDPRVGVVRGRQGLVGVDASPRSEAAARTCPRRRRGSRRTSRRHLTRRSRAPT